MTFKKTKWLLLAASTPVIWFFAASYAFVFIVGFRNSAASGFESPILGFYDQLSQSGYRPYMAYWTYLNSTSDQDIYNAAGILPMVLFAVIARIIYSIAVGSRTSRKLTRWPWQKDDRPRPLERGVTDNHGHSRMMTEAELRREFPPVR